jgi:hydroxymethylglutaryl-CoA lyase
MDAAAQNILIVDVSPRDGLQNEKVQVSPDDKIALVNALGRAGVKRIEVTSFVSPKAVPQLADAAEVMAGIERLPGVEYVALVPNMRGLEGATKARADIVNVVVAATDSFNRRNVGMDVRGSMEATARIVQTARENGGPRVSAILALAFYCPFEGPTPLERVLELTGEFVDYGITELTLADTIGAANPAQVAEWTRAVLERWPHLELGLHLHDTRGLGLANALAGVQAGMKRLEASTGGIGGCPFAPNATGNACTEDLVFMLEEMGIPTGVDLQGLIDTAARMSEVLSKPLSSRMLAAGPPRPIPVES